MSPPTRVYSGVEIRPARRPRYHLGAEYSLENLFFILTGYKTNYDEEDFSMGMGIRYAVGGFALNFDYAFMNFSNFDGVHLITVGLHATN